MTQVSSVGRRPIDGGNADGFYTALDFNDYLKQANEQRFVILQIEDPEPLKDLEAIAALEGYDMLFFGPGDFSHGIGAPGDWNNPKLIETRKLVAKLPINMGNCCHNWQYSKLNEFIDMGYKFINIGADVVGLNQYCNTLMDTFNQSVKETK